MPLFHLKVAREKRELVTVHTTSYSGDHTLPPPYCSVEHVPTHTGNRGIMIVEVILIVDMSQSFPLDL